MKKNTSIVLIFILFFSIHTARDTYAGDRENNYVVLDLKTCIDMAVENDPEIMYALDKTDIGHLQTNKAKRALFLPTIDLETSYGPKLDYFGNPVTSDDIYRSKVRFEKPLLKGGELYTGYKLGKKMVIIARHNYNQKVMDVFAETADKYYSLLAAQENLKNYIELYGQTLQIVTLLKKKFRLGAAIRLEVLEAETRLNETKYKMVKAQGDFQTAMDSLNELIGRDNGISTRVVREFPIQAITEDTNSMITRALENRPDFLYQKEITEYRKLDIDLNKSLKFPDLNLIGSYSWEGDDFPGDKEEWSAMLSLSFSLYDSTLRTTSAKYQRYEKTYKYYTYKDTDFDVNNIKLSIFDGSSNAVNLKTARAEYRLAVNRLEKLKRTIVKEVQIAVSKVREAKALQDTARKSIEFSKEKLKIIKKKLELKETNEADVMEAKTALVEAMAKNRQAEYEHAVAVINLNKATGRKMEINDSREEEQ